MVREIFISQPLLRMGVRRRRSLHRLTLFRVDDAAGERYAEILMKSQIRVKPIWRAARAAVNRDAEEHGGARIQGRLRNRGARRSRATRRRVSFCLRGPGGLVSPPLLEEPTVSPVPARS